ncbi:MAG: low molecular weight phosphotyrosine protein phosphatase [Erysipelotrichia bacterium]|nr:low molecular weight phosphotyrosine protein phosphatase [Erysipelotrichia bacterium]NCC54751.1 low molecular weight phosphotyrosine protein phosphatase [Erysipelotrichia bacterium]
MIKILFVCHGNICRSPMAEFVFKDMIKKQGIENEFYVASAATSREEIGNPVHYGTRQKLASYHISTTGKTAVQMSKQDYDAYDYLIGMESVNIRNMLKIVKADPQAKIHRLLDYTKNPRDIDDPWYTGNFDKTYDDIKEGCFALLAKIRSEKDK